MTRRRNKAIAVAATETVIVIESIPMEVKDDTAEDYQKLSDKLDDVMSKIRNRKQKK